MAAPYYAHSVVHCLCTVQIYVCQLRDVDLTVRKLTASKGSFMAEITVNPAKGTANMRTVCRFGVCLGNVVVFAACAATTLLFCLADCWGYTRSLYEPQSACHSKVLFT